MHKCIMVKIWGKQKKPKLSKKGTCNMHHWLRGMDAPGYYSIVLLLLFKCAIVRLKLESRKSNELFHCPWWCQEVMHDPFKHFE